jgi:hypothetical protein
MLYIQSDIKYNFFCLVVVFKLIYLSNLWLYSLLLDLGRFFSFLILYTFGWTP